MDDEVMAVEGSHLPPQYTRESVNVVHSSPEVYHYHTSIIYRVYKTLYSGAHKKIARTALGPVAAVSDDNIPPKPAIMQR